MTVYHLEWKRSDSELGCQSVSGIARRIWPMGTFSGESLYAKEWILSKARHNEAYYCMQYNIQSYDYLESHSASLYARKAEIWEIHLATLLIIRQRRPPPGTDQL
ncbi:hypothetical protein AVEN_182657-1 [Araneus ventricosus]|uniref:Uncharacterized protein n=1 Tax=Araneus ventricosus TaxID=182803 RepID=A0A4Y2PYR7_ARAVE|nr:hypothetical protein AVEN_182657-1 [Araneus ventricosus]